MFSMTSIKEQLVDKALENYFKKYPNSDWKGLTPESRWVATETEKLTREECFKNYSMPEHERLARQDERAKILKLIDEYYKENYIMTLSNGINPVVSQEVS